MDWKKKIALIVVIIGSIVIILSGLSMAVPVHTPSAVTEVPSSIIVSESGLPIGYNWTFTTTTAAINGVLITEYTTRTGQSTSIPYSPGLRAIIPAWFGPYVPVSYGSKSLYIGTYIVFPVDGFSFNNSNVINSAYTFYFYKAVNVTFTVSGVPSDVSWNVNASEAVGSIFGPQVIRSGANLNGNASFTVPALPGGNLSFSIFVNPTSGYIASLPNGQVHVPAGGTLVSIHLYKRTYWYTLPAYWFNEGKSLAVDYWWAILIILLGGFVGYVFEVGLPSREELRHETFKKKVKK